MTFEKRPTINNIGYIVAPRSGNMIKLIGAGANQDGLFFTRDEFRYLNKMYEMTPEQNKVMQAGATRNMFRHAKLDGLRIIAFLSRYVDAGQDPLKLVIDMASDVGLDVDAEDYSWAMVGRTL